MSERFGEVIGRRRTGGASIRSEVRRPHHARAQPGREAVYRECGSPCASDGDAPVARVARARRRFHPARARPVERRVDLSGVAGRPRARSEQRGAVEPLRGPGRTREGDALRAPRVERGGARAGRVTLRQAGRPGGVVDRRKDAARLPAPSGAVDAQVAAVLAPVDPRATRGALAGRALARRGRRAHARRRGVVALAAGQAPQPAALSVGARRTALVALDAHFAPARVATRDARRVAPGGAAGRGGTCRKDARVHGGAGASGGEALPRCRPACP